MKASPISWLQRLPAAFATAAQLLAPRSAVCLLCGKPHDSARSAATASQAKLTSQLRQSLCGACLSAIPWLTRIACTRCGRGIPCDDCIRSPQRAFVCNRSAVRYNPAMKEMLALYKYRGNEQLAPLLGDMLFPVFEAMTAELPMEACTATKSKAAKRNPADYWDAVTYVPVSAERAIERGFNQAEQLASHLGGHYRVPLVHLLQRARHSEKQSFKSRSERMRDTKALFSLNEVELDRIRIMSSASSEKSHNVSEFIRILLVDDIYTTGSTAEACAQILKREIEAPLKIYVLTWARS
ncbi:ComF family protein [Paenibacillus luteus]|uniref:ComF family protein n=1 Tax=Paenibacillus luteus TaxID=2545753 RepID=UPI00114448C7|nr:ComF family protein [Paenibacillus luteus]